MTLLSNFLMDLHYREGMMKIKETWYVPPHPVEEGKVDKSSVDD